jgi:hypothetical protein
MTHEHLMTEADRDELAAIDGMADDAKRRRARLFNRLRQRAHRIRHQEQAS